MPQQDFTVQSLARYLHLTPQQVGRLADQGRLPARKVAGQWRFSRAEIHLWLQQRIGVSDQDELLAMEGILRSGAEPEEEPVSIARLLPEKGIAIPLAARTRSAVFTAMVEVAMRTGFLWDAQKLTEAIRSREQMYPTAMENGVALLHPRRPMPAILSQAFLALGITSTGIPFGGDRGALTDVFFLICSLEDRGHLRVLARLARLISTPGFLEMLRQAPDAATAHALIRQTEATLAA